MGKRRILLFEIKVVFRVNPYSVIFGSNPYKNPLQFYYTKYYSLIAVLL